MATPIPVQNKYFVTAYLNNFITQGTLAPGTPLIDTNSLVDSINAAIQSGSHICSDYSNSTVANSAVTGLLFGLIVILIIISFVMTYKRNYNFVA